MYKIKLDIFLKHSLLGGPRSEGHYHLPMCPSQQPGHPSFSSPVHQTGRNVLPILSPFFQSYRATAATVLKLILNFSSKLDLSSTLPHLTSNLVNLTLPFTLTMAVLNCSRKLIIMLLLILTLCLTIVIVCSWFA